MTKLGEIGLLDPTVHDEREYFESRDRQPLKFDYHGRRYVGRTTHFGRGDTPSWIVFSSLGAELLPLVEKPGGLNDEYFRACCQCLSKPNWVLDSSTEFQELIVEEELLSLLNLTKPREAEST